MLGRAGAVFRIFGANAAIDSAGGGPRAWYDLVQNERQRRGVGLASGPSPVAPVNESIEQQIARIDALLNEKESPIDLRIYRTQIGCSVDSGIAGADMEVETQIRGIDGITTVKSLVDSRRPLTPTTEYVVFEIKFELLGASSRKEYRERVLFPGLRRVPGLNIVDWSSVHRTNVRGTIRTVRESKLNELRGGFGSGYGGTTTAYAGTSDPLPTPRLSLQAVAQDWMEGGVQMYDMPTNMADMQYHVMIPVDELWEYGSREYRGDANTFHAGYENFIKYGAKLPVYVAVGQNGRIRITGNEDLVWFAKKSGLKELPAFISYQKQV